MDGLTYKVVLNLKIAVVNSSFYLSILVDDDLAATLVIGGGTTISELQDGRNSVSVHPETQCLVSDVKYRLPNSEMKMLAAFAAAHAVLYLPFRGPSMILFEVIYARVMKFAIPLSAAENAILRIIHCCRFRGTSAVVG